MYQIDNLVNKIFCDDCISFMSKMPDECVNLVLTDIPYGVVSRPSGGLRRLDKGSADKTTFSLHTFIPEIIRVCSGSIYVFCASEQISDILTIIKQHGLIMRSCIWEKTNPSPMNGENVWLSNIEHCAFGKKHGAAFNEYCKGTVWKYPAGSSERHPTEKNVKLFKYLVSVSSNPGDVVFDPCIGSGTTAEAAVALGRRVVGVDCCKKYCEIAERRIAEELAQPDLFIKYPSR